ncbi:hypothetical protein CASFOL_020590 [Castilleja foliolosa]|uniref:Uncharacterized protein n=1 Tax=Castilleja foliolosa TaxID=1961234 RepID=A0ABD3D1A4_9LAMI
MVFHWTQWNLFSPAWFHRKDLKILSIFLRKLMFTAEEARV